MSKSEPKPKIQYKNFQQLLKSQSITKHHKKNSFSQKTSPQVLTNITNHGSTFAKPKFIKPKTQTNEELPFSQMYSTFYHEIDAIFTELEDFYCQAKEKVINQLRGFMQKNNINKAQEKVDEMKKMSEYIQKISNFFIDEETTAIKEDIPPVAYCNTKKIVDTENYEEELGKMAELSMKNTKIRANQRKQMVNYRKKSVYEVILEKKESRARLATSVSRNQKTMQN